MLIVNKLHVPLFCSPLHFSFSITNQYRHVFLPLELACLYLNQRAATRTCVWTHLQVEILINDISLHHDLLGVCMPCPSPQQDSRDYRSDFLEPLEFTNKLVFK